MSTDESLLEFPCDFPLKVIGESTDEFRLAVLEIINRHTVDTATPTIRPSRDDRYVALTFSVKATSRAQLDALYSDLSAHDLVLFAL